MASEDIECKHCEGTGRDIKNPDADVGPEGDMVDATPKCPECYGETVVYSDWREQEMWKLACKVSEAVRLTSSPRLKKLIEEASAKLDEMCVLMRDEKEAA